MSTQPVLIALKNGMNLSLNLNPFIEFLEDNVDKDPQQVAEHFSKGLNILFPLLKERNPECAHDFTQAALLLMESAEVVA